MPEGDKIYTVGSKTTTTKKQRESASLFNKLPLTSGFRLADRSWCALKEPLRGSVLKAAGTVWKWSHGVGEGDPFLPSKLCLCAVLSSHPSVLALVDDHPARACLKPGSRLCQAPLLCDSRMTSWSLGSSESKSMRLLHVCLPALDPHTLICPTAFPSDPQHPVSSNFMSWEK